MDAWYPPLQGGFGRLLRRSHQNSDQQMNVPFSALLHHLIGTFSISIAAENIETFMTVLVAFENLVLLTELKSA